MDITTKYTITVGRQFGSGGRVIGQALARELGIDYYDKTLLSEAAKHAGLSPHLFERNDEKAPSLFSNILSMNMGYSAYSIYPGSSSISDDSIYNAQNKVIQLLADRSSCVIVGRSADYALRDRDNVVNVFIHAPRDVCARRVLERGDAATIEQARQLVDKTNKLRSAYYNFYTDKRWGRASSYDLTFDSSLLDTHSIIQLIKHYINLRFK